MWQKYTEIQIKGLNVSDKHKSMENHLKPDILECEVKWPSGSITTRKTSGGDGIIAGSQPVQLLSHVQIFATP